MCLGISHLPISIWAKLVKPYKPYKQMFLKSIFYRFEETLPEGYLPVCTRNLRETLMMPIRCMSNFMPIARLRTQAKKHWI